MTNTDIAGKITIEEKIGQMLMVGFDGYEIDDYSQISIDIKNGKVGGVILFDRNGKTGLYDKNIKSPAQLKILIDKLKSFSKIPLFVAIDQEGGQVARLNEKSGFPSTLSQYYLGKLDNYQETTKSASETAATLDNVGINLNMAPVVDLNINPDNPVIGAKERSFSENPEIVYKHAEIVIEEHSKKNIFCVIKHFPGHGSSKTDSHLGLTDVSEMWSEMELIPFKKIFNAKLTSFVMTAHIFNKKLDEDYPATLSKKIIYGMLRQRLHYDDLVFSDDMNMKSITDFYGFEKSLELAINAGIDILVFGNNMNFVPNIASKAHSCILNLLVSKKISIDRINESFFRILNAKSKLNSVL